MIGAAAGPQALEVPSGAAEARPADVGVRPTDVETRPTDVETRPPDVGVRPRAVGPRPPGTTVRPSAGRGTAARARVPRWLALPAALGASLVMVPLAAMALRVDWSRFGALVSGPASVDALALSMRTSACATAACVVLGAPLALVLARATFPGQRLLRALVLLPLVLPPVVGGMALLSAFGRLGLLGSAMEAVGIRIAFSTGAVVLAQTFVAMPFLVLSWEGTLRALGDRYEVVAATLGARPTTVLVRITGPLALPGLASAAVLSFARALGEFGATMTFAGSLQGTTRTLPLEVYLQRVTDPDAAIALSLLLVGVGVLVTLVTWGLTGRQRWA